MSAKQPSGFLKKTYLDISTEEWLAKNCNKEAWLAQITRDMPETLRYDPEQNLMIETKSKLTKLKKKLKKKRAKKKK